MYMYMIVLMHVHLHLTDMHTVYCDQILHTSLFLCLQFACQLCYQIFKNKLTLVYHLRAKHKIGDAFRCATCGKDDFSSYDVFRRHRKKCQA